jgi:hypothetical protein
MSCSERNIQEPKQETKAVKQLAIQEHFTYKEIPISGTAYLRFYDFDENLGLFFEPKLIINSQKFEIKGYDSSTYGNKGAINAVSPNGNYFIIDLIKESKTKTLEYVGCAIIDIQNKILVRILENSCDGAWNNANQWIYDNKVIVSFD